MLIVNSPQSGLHVPPFAVIDGERRPSYDQPERVAAILSAVGRHELGSVVAPGPLDMSQVAAVHDPGMLDYLATVSDDLDEDMPVILPACWPPSGQRRRPTGLKGLKGYYCTDTETPVAAHTWEAALAAASCAAAGAQCLLDGEHTVYALCRPPGHHAGPDFFGGYCYLNNAAVAAHMLAQAGGPVAVADFDYHHGNGTQAIFYARDDVWYGSVHVDPATTYPYYSGYDDEVGEGPGAGANVNLPLPPGAAEERYLGAAEELLAEAQARRPARLVVSIGFDTYAGDPFSSFGMTADGFYKLGTLLRAVGLPTLAVQEGGYHLPDLGELAAAFLDGLAGG
jgi:acetoin utilization deacetylase AcuC-like enzyme